jgi:carbohydrate-binding DOMON domain-containing protein
MTEWTDVSGGWKEGGRAVAVAVLAAVVPAAATLWFHHR